MRGRNIPRTSTNLRESPRISTNLRESPRISANLRESRSTNLHESPRISANLRESQRISANLKEFPGISTATQTQVNDFVGVFWFRHVQEQQNARHVHAWLDKTCFGHFLRSGTESGAFATKCTFSVQVSPWCYLACCWHFGKGHCHALGARWLAAVGILAKGAWGTRRSCF